MALLMDKKQIKKGKTQQMMDESADDDENAEFAQFDPNDDLDYDIKDFDMDGNGASFSYGG